MKFSSLNINLSLLQNIKNLLQIYLPNAAPRRKSISRLPNGHWGVPVLGNEPLIVFLHDRDVCASASTLRSPHSAQGHKIPAELYFLPGSVVTEERNSSDLQTLFEQRAQTLCFNELLSPWLESWSISRHLSAAALQKLMICSLQEHIQIQAEWYRVSLLALYLLILTFSWYLTSEMWPRKVTSIKRETGIAMRWWTAHLWSPSRMDVVVDVITKESSCFKPWTDFPQS